MLFSEQDSMEHDKIAVYVTTGLPFPIMFPALQHKGASGGKDVDIEPRIFLVLSSRKHKR